MVQGADQRGRRGSEKPFPYERFVAQSPAYWATALRSETLLAEDAGTALGVGGIADCHWSLLDNLEMAGEGSGIANPSHHLVLALATWACHLLAALAWMESLGLGCGILGKRSAARHY